MSKPCNNCGTLTYYRFCKPCYENTWPMYKCSRCKEDFRRNFNKKRETRCTKCIENTKTCKFCNRKFNPFADEDNCTSCAYSEFKHCLSCNTVFIRNKYYSQEEYCRECSNKRTKILDCLKNTSSKNTKTKTSENDCKPGFIIKITYRVQSEDHSGYCSDPYEVTKDEYEETKEYPLIKEFKNEHIDRDTGIVTLEGYQWPLSYYNISSHYHGNGYCGCETEYFIKSARVIRIKERIDLDECPSDSDEGDR